MHPRSRKVAASAPLATGAGAAVAAQGGDAPSSATTMQPQAERPDVATATPDATTGA